jgi:hypothetical protein
MKRRLPSLQRLLELARHDAQRRARPVTSADAREVRHIAQRALAALPGRAGFKPVTRPFADVFERLCWRAAGATAAVCLALLLLHRPAPEPDVSVLLLDWPAETGDLF